jgi:hypothetical protein
MKRLDFSKIIIVAVLLMFVSCKKHDEIAFKGTIIDTRTCNSSFEIQHNDAGFVINLTTPDSIGKPYTHNGVTYPNAVILYEPGCRLYKNDKVSGTFYLDDKYSRANCSIHWSDYDIPEGVFVDVSVE